MERERKEGIRIRTVIATVFEFAFWLFSLALMIAVLAVTLGAGGLAGLCSWVWKGSEDEIITGQIEYERGKKPSRGFR